VRFEICAAEVPEEFWALNFAACAFLIAVTIFAYSGDERCVETTFPRAFPLDDFGLSTFVFVFMEAVKCLNQLHLISSSNHCWA
jgi:hypothetical protein